MSSELPAAAQRIQDFLAARGVATQVVALPASTRTAAEAAAAIGCEVSHIAKSIVFRAVRSDRPILVVASGVSRIDEARVADLAAEPITKASPDFVKERTGFVIGGVPPVGHPEPLTTFVDESLLAYPAIWAAAGTPRTVFRLTPAELVSLSKAVVASVREKPGA
jgi:prolyl-tRNA editing enzyme YbaK/EbsC (Cys-tRNA(Pro) deacylase)